MLEPGPRSQRRQLLDYLRSLRLLLVLDNYEHVDEQGQLLAEIVATAPGVALLVTSRERLLLHCEQVVTLEGLAVPPADDSPDAADHSAVQLFVRAAQRASPDFAAQQVAALHAAGPRRWPREPRPVRSRRPPGR